MSEMHENMMTVCVTTFNRWPSCARTVNSLLNQKPARLQIILVDDHSADPIDPELLSKLRDGGHRYIRHERNMGLAAARNSAIREAEGRWFSFCDDDDQWSPSLAKRFALAIDSVPEDVGVILALREEQKCDGGYLFEDYPCLTELMKAGLTPPVGSQVYRTKLLREIGGYRPEVLSGVDHDLWVSLAHSDPKVGVAWGRPAIAGRCASRARLTTVEWRRRAGIGKSLEIWRDDLCAVFGERFYLHFVASYQWYLDYSFFIQSIQKRDYLDIAMRAIRSPSLTVEIFTRSLDRLRGRSRCTLFPEFVDD